MMPGRARILIIFFLPIKLMDDALLPEWIIN